MQTRDEDTPRRGFLATRARDFARNRHGQGSVEYGVLIAIGLVIVVAIAAFGDRVVALFGRLGGKVDSYGN